MGESRLEENGWCGLHPQEPKSILSTSILCFCKSENNDGSLHGQNLCGEMSSGIPFWDVARGRSSEGEKKKGWGKWCE